MILLSIDVHEKWSQEWAENTKSIEIYDLDPDRAWNNHLITPYIVGQVIDEGECVDKLKIELRNLDFGDLMANIYSARLEIEGKGVFIDIPRVSLSFYHEIENMYTQTVEEDKDHAAHSVQALKIAEDEVLQKKTLYFKFPDGRTCNALHFNGEVNRDQHKKLALKPLPTMIL